MQRIKVPPSAIAHIIGKGGANIKDLQSRSGAKCRLQGNYVQVTGSPGACKIAINLIQDCIDNSVAVYNHPVEAIIALRQPLVGLKSVKFVKYQGIVDACNVNKAYFVLDKGEDNDITSSLKTLNIRETTMSDIIAPKDDNTLVKHMVKRLTEGMTKSNDELKIRLNIGKQLFYPACKGVVNLPPLVPLDHLIKYKVGYKADVKTTFMNRLPINIAKAIESRLKKLGYEEDSNTTQRASIHVIDIKRKRRITISNDITPEGFLKLRKCQPDNVNYLLLSFVRAKSALDFRFKVLSNGEPITIIPSELVRIIENATYDLDAKTVTLPASTEYRVTLTRVKIKRKFINNAGNKVTISNVYETGKKDIQVTMTNSELKEALTKMKNDNAPTGRKEEGLEEKIAKFANEMNRIVDGVQWEE